MSLDVRLKLLEMTGTSPAVDIAMLSTHSGLRMSPTLESMTSDGLLTCADGIFSMSHHQRMMLAEQLIHGGVDPKRVSRCLGWQEFEDFANQSLLNNGFATRKHCIFKTTSGRREIDILAWNDSFTLALDCKHWVTGMSPSAIRRIVRAQIERAKALADRPELLHRLKVGRPEKRYVTPVILVLAELRDQLVDGVPVVPISKLISFIYGLSPVAEGIERIRVSRGKTAQLRLG